MGIIASHIIPDTDQKILIYCEKGIRSEKACKKLFAENHDLAIYHIAGGIAAWRQAGFSIES